MTPTARTDIIDHMIKVMQACKDGKTIVTRRSGVDFAHDSWKVVSSPLWNWGENDYKVQTVPKWLWAYHCNLKDRIQITDQLYTEAEAIQRFAAYCVKLHWTAKECEV